MIGNTTHLRCATSRGGGRPRFRVSRISERLRPHDEAATGHAPEARTALGDFWRAFHAVAETTVENLGNSPKMQRRSVGTGNEACGKCRKSGMTGHRATAGGVLPVTLIFGAGLAVGLCGMRLVRRNRRHSAAPIDKIRLVVQCRDRRNLRPIGDVTAVCRSRPNGQKESHRRERQGSQQPGNGMGSTHDRERAPRLVSCQSRGAITLVRHEFTVSERKLPQGPAPQCVPVQRWTSTVTWERPSMPARRAL